MMSEGKEGEHSEGNMIKSTEEGVRGKEDKYK